MVNGHLVGHFIISHDGRQLLLKFIIGNGFLISSNLKEYKRLRNLNFVHFQAVRSTIQRKSVDHADENHSELKITLCCVSKLRIKNHVQCFLLYLLI